MTETPAEDALVPVCRLGRYFQAEMLRQALQAEGIDSIADGENFASLFGLTTAAPWAIRIMVRQRDKAKALQVLQELTEGHEDDVQLLTD